MKYLVVSLLVFLSIAYVPFSTKSHLVEFEKEMARAKFIGKVVIESYDTNGVFQFRSLEFKDTIRSAQSHLWFNKFRYTPLDTADYWTTASPKAKDTVLIVLDSTYKISLFAKLIDDDYRFWDPINSISVATFSFKLPARKLKETRFHTQYASSCWDGCLVHKDSLDFYRKKRF